MVEISQTRKLLLRVARAGKDALGLDDKKPQGASLVHEYWKRFYAQRFQEQGHKTFLESPRKSGNADVLALKDGKSIAIEIETGKSDVVKNVQQDLLSGFDKILVVATDAKALRKVEQELAHAGLIIPNKVDMVLRDQIVGC